MKTKYILISSLILASFLTPSLSVLNAQVVDTPATTAQVDALKETLISLLTQLIAQLQSQINVLIAQQASTTQAVSNLASVQSAPVLGSVATSTPKILSKVQKCEYLVSPNGENVVIAPDGHRVESLESGYKDSDFTSDNFTSRQLTYFNMAVSYTRDHYEKYPNDTSWQIPWSAIGPSPSTSAYQDMLFADQRFKVDNALWLACLSQ